MLNLFIFFTCLIVTIFDSLTGRCKKVNSLRQNGLKIVTVSELIFPIWWIQPSAYCAHYYNTVSIYTGSTLTADCPVRFFSILGKFSFRIHGQGRQEGVPIISEFISGHGFLCYKFVIEVINNTIGAETSELLTNHLSKFLSFFLRSISGHLCCPIHTWRLRSVWSDRSEVELGVIYIYFKDLWIPAVCSRPLS